jgi:hypothetical protein
VTFTAPTENGAEITSYTILVVTSDGLTFVEDSTNCDGSDATILSNLSCTIPLETLKDSPYDLSFGD